jgi:hypothetical protein
LPSRRSRTEVALGWADFDQVLAARIGNHDTNFVDTRDGGGMACPLNRPGHDGEWLRWHSGKARGGTDWHGAPRIRFRARPTFILEDALDNFIVGHDLVREALDRKWGKAEVHRLSHENSEDAVTWNVFRSLQEAAELPLAVRVLGGVDPEAEPVLYLWGREVRPDASRPWPRLTSARNAVEPWGGQQTEPDCCIHVPGQAWLFVEAKFGSPTTTKKTDAARDAWLERYERTCPGVFDRDAVRLTPARLFPEQLLRNVALGLNVRYGGERLIVVALVRDRDATSAPAAAARCVSLEAEVDVLHGTWESIYDHLPARSQLDGLRRYFETKSFRLRPAFNVREVQLGARP